MMWAEQYRANVPLSDYIKLAWNWIHTEKTAPVHRRIKQDTKSSQVRFHFPGLGFRLFLGSPMLLMYAFAGLTRGFGDIKWHNLYACNNVNDMTTRVISNEYGRRRGN